VIVIALSSIYAQMCWQMPAYDGMCLHILAIYSHMRGFASMCKDTVQMLACASSHMHASISPHMLAYTSICFDKLAHG
jgi:hypothetical protein